MNITSASTLTHSRLSAPSVASQETFDARAKGDDLALLDNFVRTPLLAHHDMDPLKDFAVGALPGAGLLKNGSDYLTHAIFGNDKASQEKGVGALLNLGGTAGLIYGLASGSGLVALASGALLAGSGIIAAR